MFSFRLRKGMRLLEPTDVIDGCRLYLADCRDVLPSLEPVDAVITDPPYLTSEAEITYEHAGVASRTSPTTTVGMPWGYSLDWVEACAQLEPLHWVVFCNYLMLADVIKAVERHAKLSSVFAWRKSNAPNMTRPVPRLDCEFIVWARSSQAKCGRMGEFKSLVLDVPMPQAGCMASERLLERGTGKAAHPCQKPIAVVRPFVKRLEVKRIIDPFLGTGTTGIAAIQEGCSFVGIESDPHHYATALKRLTHATGTGPGQLFAGMEASSTS